MTDPGREFLSQSDDADDGMGCPFGRGLGPVPELNVTKPTPTSSPNPTPPTSRKTSETELPSDTDSHSSGTCVDNTESFKSIRTPSPTFNLKISSTGEDGEDDDVHLELLQNLHHGQASSSFMANMRIASMSPLAEDLNEEENGFSPAAGNTDEGIVVHKTSVSSEGSSGGGLEMNIVPSAESREPVTKPPGRKISDVSVVSDHSGESGIDSTTSKVSDASKDGNQLDRESKHSSASNSSTEDELAYIRHSRAGSVSKTVEKYDTLTRHRKSGLQTVQPVPLMQPETDSTPHNGGIGGLEQNPDWGAKQGQLEREECSSPDNSST